MRWTFLVTIFALESHSKKWMHDHIFDPAMILVGRLFDVILIPESNQTWDEGGSLTVRW